MLLKANNLINIKAGAYHLEFARLIRIRFLMFSLFI